MSATKLVIVNKVMRKLRESKITTIDGDDYAELITDFLTETKREIEDAWDWTVLKGTVLLDTVVGTYRYKLSNVYERSEIHDVYNQTHDVYLQFNPSVVKEGLKLSSPTTGTPCYYDIVGYNDSEMLIDVFPVPDVADVRLYVNGKYVQGDLGYTVPDELITTNTMANVLGTYAKAIQERGEDDGEAVTKAEAAYHRALSDAVAMDDSIQGNAKSEWSTE